MTGPHDPREVLRPAIAIVLPAGDGRTTGEVYDDGRATERLLIGASMLGHPSAAASAPKRRPGEARLPRDRVVRYDRWSD